MVHAICRHFKTNGDCSFRTVCNPEKCDKYELPEEEILLLENQRLRDTLKEISMISHRSEDIEIDNKIICLARYEGRIEYSEHIAKQALEG